MLGAGGTDRRGRAARIVIVAAIAGVAAAMVAPAHAQAPAPSAAEVAAIQAREARNADARTLASLERFRAALVARFGADPRIVMLAFDEQEGSALVARAGAAPEYVIRQGDAWISTANRRLAPWAPPELANANAFPLSSLHAAPIRAWLDGWRKTPGRANDFVTDYQVGYDPAAGRVLVRARIGSMTSFGITQHSFDPASGQAVVVAAAAPPARPKAPPVKSTDSRRDVAAALAALRREVPTARLASMRIERRGIEFTLADRTTWTFDGTHMLVAGRRYEGSFHCDRGWMESEVDWTKLASLPRNGVLAAGLDDEDEAHARFRIDRPSDCGPLAIEVTYTNYQIPQPWVRFDPQGAFLRHSR